MTSLSYNELKDYVDQLDRVNAAIEKAQQAQSYTINGRTMERPDLSELYKERARLEPLARRERELMYGEAQPAPRPTTIRVSTSKGL